jgi:D-glycero-D-manno-heptose 1,7-bisphosphate phosphatase
MTSINNVNKALFLDRDGVINVNHGYVGQIDSFDWIDGIFDLVKSAKGLGYKIIVVTNQSGIGRGYYSQDDFQSLTMWMQQEFANRQASIDKVYHCPHHPTEALAPFKLRCLCRKPSPGMALDAQDEFSIDLNASVMVGDKISDIEFAENAKIGKAFLLNQGSTLSHIEKRQFNIDVDIIEKISDINL